MVLLFLYLFVRGNGIAFVNSVLGADKIDGIENESESLTEITYARNKRYAKEKAEQ